MIRLSFYRGLFAAAITAATVSEMVDAVSIEADNVELLMMPQVQSGLETGADLYSDVDSTAATDSAFISTLFNKVKGGAKSLLDKTRSVFRQKKGKQAKQQMTIKNKAKARKGKQKRQARAKAKQTNKKKVDMKQKNRVKKEQEKQKKQAAAIKARQAAERKIKQQKMKLKAKKKKECMEKRRKKAEMVAKRR